MVIDIDKDSAVIAQDVLMDYLQDFDWVFDRAYSGPYDP
jgi:hypothetical protein